MHDNNSLAHTSWKCKYHIVFAPKYRRKIFYDNNKAEIGKILRELCEWKGVHIIEAELCPDHIHMLVEIPPKQSVSGFMGFLKGKSSIIIHQRHGSLKYKYGNMSFWCRGYCGYSRQKCKTNTRIYERVNLRQHRTNKLKSVKEHITMNYNQKTSSKSSHMRTNSGCQTMSVSQNNICKCKQDIQFCDLFS